MARAIDADNFGAWLIKCDPLVWDFPGFIEDGNDLIQDTWSLHQNYRSDMMQFGDRILFWLSGTQPKFPRGIWGAGYVVGEAGGVAGFADDADEFSYWLDEDARLAVRYCVPVYIPLRLDAPVTDAALRAAGIDDLEVQRMPSGSNPSWVSLDQLAKLDVLLGAWPEPPDALAEITVTDQGAGFGDPLQNQAVEDAAMDAAVQAYQDDDWNVADVSTDKLGWDLTCTHPDGRTAKIEVKGVSASRPTVLLTANELRAATDEHDWVLLVVTHALSATPKITEYSREEALAVATPYVFRADLDTLRR
ncbi:DUF3883 domain-containing protein [Dactylosporangium sp. NPDC000244]|uniref:protein NO VEIN domain-containing protein n=1 Tax=Dactylosporangium sp. NPDC000244 TaxID=3154365 RepID=UPI00332D864E